MRIGLLSTIPLMATLLAFWLMRGHGPLPHAAFPGLLVASSLASVGVMARELLLQAKAHSAARAESEQRAALLASVARAARTMSSLDTDRVMEVAIDSLSGLRFEAAAVAVFDDEGSYRITHSAGGPEEFAQADHPASLGMVGRVRERRGTLVVEDYSEQPWAVQEFKEAGFQTCIGTPILSQSIMVGVLVAGSTRKLTLYPAEVEAFELLAAQAGIALENARQFEGERRAVEHLAELDRLKSNFLSTVSHELRTPLTVIVGNGQTLLSNWSTFDESLRLELLERLTANAMALENIITTMLDFSRLEAGHLEVRAQAFDLQRVLGSAAGRLSTLFSEHPLSVDIEDGQVVLGDPSLIDRVVENLLVNAARHTRPGTQVRLSAQPDGRWAVVTVEDDGQGIAPQDLEHLGERFFRAGDPNVRSVKGTGLGLALAREVLDLHGTELKIESALGEGSRFSFELPLVTSAARADQPAQAQPV
jgi:K+-sensing histidine kinase KdpD